MERRSRIIAGTMLWGIWGKNLDTAGMIELISSLHDMGVYRYDHADIYGGYTTEIAWGAAFSQSGIPRNEVEIVSKCGIMLPSEARPLIREKHYNHTYEHIVKSAQRSIADLQCGYLDMLLIHRPSPLMRFEEMARAMEDLQAEGLVKSFGVSNFDNFQLKSMAEYYPIAAHQIEISLAHHYPMTNGQVDACMDLGIECMAWSPLASGRLFDTKSVLYRRLRTLSEQVALDVDQLAYYFISHHPANISTVVGSTDPVRIRRAMDSIYHSINDELWYAIYTTALGNEVP